jgi:ABC-type phosphate/phosphonate transport system substrate-binding protein
MSLISANYLSSAQNGLFQAILTWLVDQIGLDLAPATDGMEQDPDLVFMCGLPTGRTIDRLHPLVGVVMAQERYGGMPIYFSDLVVRAGRPGPPLPSWKIAYNETSSFSGSIAPRWGLETLGLKPEAMTWIATGSHSNSLQSVRQGQADAAGIDSMVLDLIAGESSPGAGLETIESFGPWPVPPISTAAAMDPNLRSAILAALTSMNQDPGGAHLLSTWGVDRLVPVEASDYERLARFAQSTVHF